MFLAAVSSVKKNLLVYQALPRELAGGRKATSEVG